MDMDQYSISDLEYNILDSQQNTYVTVATIAVIVYDSMITLEKEIKYFWGEPFSFNLLLFFLVRYSSFISPLTSYFLYNIVNCGIDILVLRTLALCHNGRNISIFLYSLVTIEAIIVFIISLKADPLFSVTSLKFGLHLSFCDENIDLASSILIPNIVSWLLPVLTSLFLMVLAIYKSADYWKMSSGFKGLKLVEVLIRDQAVYFFVRMMFNLKEAGELGVNGGTNYRPSLSGTLSSPEFA
ncbi:hypothetical protein PNOK_0953600 [Pyrrhoderma noxium]|uniref:DUF6533 domain-containing protein n=1 Tax=Pyrrhoderma noxium TaxID=2282107 RepID=A0A286U5Y4_9AGAM|nr:hypothetical protein PNOK_0953600 [Pyrrhoderma noxium]